MNRRWVPFPVSSAGPLELAIPLRDVVILIISDWWRQPYLCHTLSYMVERMVWDDKAADHIRTRSARYAGAVDIEPGWIVEVVNDPHRLVDEPDPKSRHANGVRIVGYSLTARMVMTRRGTSRCWRRAARRVRVEDPRRSTAPVSGGTIR